MDAVSRYSIRAYVDHEGEKKMQSYESILNEQLMKHGVRITCSPNRNQDRKGLTAYALIVTIDHEITSRGAGRKKLETNFSISEAMQLESDGLSKQQIAESMGVSMATYYRRRRQFLKGK